MPNSAILTNLLSLTNHDIIIVRLLKWTPPTNEVAKYILHICIVIFIKLTSFCLKTSLLLVKKKICWWSDRCDI